MEHGQRFVQSFIDKRRRERYLALLETPHGLKRFGRELDDLELDSARCQKIAIDEQKLDSIYDRLKANGASERCFVFSCVGIAANDKDAGMGLADALEAVVGSAAGTVMSCIAGRLAYYEADGENARYICRA